MSEELDTTMLKAVLEQYAIPDPKIVGTIPRNGVNISYVSHADITKILIEIDPNWNWQPVAWDNGRPAIHVENGTATMWGTLTLLGKSMLGVGSVRADKQDHEKELIGDFLRNASMRFGIALSLWSKQDWSDNTTIVRTPEVKRSMQNHPASQSLDDREITPAEVAEIFGGSVVNEAVITPIKAAVTGGLISEKQKGLISKLAKEKVDGDVTPILKQQFKKTSVNELTTKEGSALIKLLMEATVGKPVVLPDEEAF
jgi:hypothetical protein